MVFELVVGDDGGGLTGDDLRRHRGEHVLRGKGGCRRLAKLLPAIVQDDGTAAVKSRIVILGFMNPHVLLLERSAPTPTNEAFTSTMQVMASLGFYAVSSDICNAFS